MSGFRKVEVPREQLVLWEQRLDDAIPPDHPVRQVEYLLSSKAFAKWAFRLWRGPVTRRSCPPEPKAPLIDVSPPIDGHAASTPQATRSDNMVQLTVPQE